MKDQIMQQRRQQAVKYILRMRVEEGLSEPGMRPAELAELVF
jgi:hypothetical protein